MLYIELYRWHLISHKVQKILVHGAQMIMHAMLFMGQLIQDVSEARNKNFRQ